MIHVSFLLLGLGSGAVFGSLALGLVMTYRSSGVVNFAVGAIAIYVSYTFVLLRSGEFFNPIPGFPKTIHVASHVPTLIALVVSLVVAALLGTLLYLCIFRFLREAPPLARVIASMGVLTFIISLLALRIGGSPLATGPIFPASTFHIGTVSIPTDRFYFAGTIIAIALAIWAIGKYTRFGLATRAVAVSEKGAYVTGISPTRIALANWALSSVVAGLGGILIAPLVALDPNAYTLFVIPALAAALAGGFNRLAPTVIAALVIGMLQAEIGFLQLTHTWLPQTGLQEAVPLAIVVAILGFSRQALPDRGTIITQSLARAPRPVHLLRGTALGLGLALLALLALHGGYREGVIHGFIFSILGLSYVVITGYMGQISLAQLTLAGVAGFMVVRLGTDFGVPFPIAPLLAALCAVAAGLLAGIPALRIRGGGLAVVTLTLAVAVQAFWFNNSRYDGGVKGAQVTTPKLFGVDLGIGQGTSYPRLAFGALCLVVLLIAALGVAKMRTSRLGLRMLAVRANERSAAAAGVDVSRTKMHAIAISSLLAGIGGALIAYDAVNVSAASYDVIAGVFLFATIYLAGITSVSGGILAGVIAPGALFFTFMQNKLALGSWYGFISAVGLIFTVVRHPEGIVGPVHNLIARRRALVVDEPDDEVDVEHHAPPPATINTSAAASRGSSLRVEQLVVRYGGVVANDSVSLTVHPGTISGLIGPNGAGKTTLLDAVTGFARYEGNVWLEDELLDRYGPVDRARRGVIRTFQGGELSDDLSVWENLLVGETAARQEHVSVDRLERILDLLDLTPLRNRLVSDLSQGHRRLVGVGRALAGAPRVVLLDEPASGLDSDESAWLGERIRRLPTSGMAVILVEHDMSLVMNICDYVNVLDYGKLIASGTPAEVRANPAVVAAYLGDEVVAPPVEATAPAHGGPASS